MAEAGIVEQTRWQRYSHPFITGVLGFLPLALTLAVLAWVIVFLHDLVGPSSSFGRILGSVGLSFVACEVIAYTFGLVGTLVVVYLFGVLVESGKAFRYQSVIEGAVNRIPLVGTIYDASKQLTNMFDRNNQDVGAMTPVLCFFGEGNAAATLALMPTSELIRFGNQDYHIVVIPTAPVPFGGALLFVPADRVKPAGCSFDGVINVFMSMGASAPDFLGEGLDTKTDQAND